MFDRRAPKSLLTPAGTRFRLLGPVSLERDGATVALGGPLQLTLLACLLLRAGAVVPRERLIDELWRETPPPGARRALETKVSRLRAALARDARIEARAGGYVLEIGDAWVDAARFQTAMSEATVRARDDPAAARAVVEAALVLWEGEALGGLPDGLLAAERAQLEEQRLQALELRAELALALGEARTVVGELEALRAAHPLRESFSELLMLAQYRAGRQSDALRTYREARRHLVDELGLEPGPRLRDLHQAILTHAPSLGAAPLGHGAVRRARRPVVLGGFAVVAALAVTAIVMLPESGPSASRKALPPPGLLLIDAATGRAKASVPVGDNQGYTEIGYGAAWTIGENGVISQVDIERGRLVRSIPVGVQGNLAIGAGGVWVADTSSPTLVRVDPLTGQVNLRARLPVRGLRSAGGSGGTAVYRGSLWVVRGSEAVDRLDPHTLRVQRRIPLHLGPCTMSHCQLAAGDGRVWVVGSESGRALAIDAATNRVVVRTRLAKSACCIVAGGGEAWVAAAQVLLQVSRTGRVVRRFKVRADAVGNVSYAHPYAWATADSTGELLRIDPRSGHVRTFHLGNALVGVAATGATIAVNAIEPQGDVTAGLGPKVLRIGLPHDYLNSTDPAMARSPDHSGRWQWDFQEATCAGLYRAGVSGPERELAGVAERAPDALVWRIPIRHGWHFAPPVRREVSARDVRATLVRALAPQLRPRSPAVRALRDVVGVAAYRRGRSTGISGITVAGDVVVIRTRRPVHDLPARLAQSYFCVLPDGLPAPPGGLPDRLPTAGPYYVSARGGTTVLRPNPGYGGTRPRRLDGIIFSLSIDESTGARLVDAGRLDVFGGDDLVVARRVGCRRTRPGLPGIGLAEFCLR